MINGTMKKNRFEISNVLNDDGSIDENKAYFEYDEFNSLYEEWKESDLI